MKTHLLVAFALCMNLAIAVAAPDSSGPDALVQKLYKAHVGRSGPFSHPKNRSLVEQYFTTELAGLIVKDAVAAGDEIGALDFDPLYDSQDPEIKNFQIGRPNFGNNAAIVAVSFTDQGEARTLRFRLEQNAQKAWRIADVAYGDGRTMAGILRGSAHR